MISNTPARLLCYTVKGSQSRFLPCDQPNREYLSQIYVCATTLREMASLIKKHLPLEDLTVVDISQAEKQWSSNMKWITPEPGVWASRFVNGPIVYRLCEGERTEID